LGINNMFISLFSLASPKSNGVRASVNTSSGSVIP
jgi:hypothetical protein